VDSNDPGPSQLDPHYEYALSLQKNDTIIPDQTHMTLTLAECTTFRTACPPLTKTSDWAEVTANWKGRSVTY
jgi:hypothetical protein